MIDKQSSTSEHDYASNRSAIGQALEPLEHSVLLMARTDGPMEGAPVLEPIEHSVLEKPLYGGSMKEMSVLEPLEHSVLLMARTDGPMEGAPVLEPIEHSVLEKPHDGGPLVKTSILGPLQNSVPDVAPAWGDCSLFDPLEHSGLNVHVDVDSLWLAPWDAGGTLSTIGLEWLSGELCCVRLLDCLIGRCFRLWGLGGLLATSEGHVLWTWTRGSREPLRIFWEMTLR